MAEYIMNICVILALLLSHIVIYKTGEISAAKQIAKDMDKNYIGTIRIDPNSDNFMNVSFHDNPIKYTGRYVMFKIESVEPSVNINKNDAR